MGHLILHAVAAVSLPAIHGKLHGSGLSDYVSCDWLPQLELCGYRLVGLYQVKLSARISGEGTSGNQLTGAHTCAAAGIMK